MANRAGADQILVEGLSESIRALGKVSRDLANEARGLIRDEAKHLQREAQSRLQRRPGGGSYPRRKGMIRYGATNRGGTLSIVAGNRYPWAFGAEFGARRAWVFGRVTSAAVLSRRQFAPWAGNQFRVTSPSGPGWIVQPTIRDNLPRIKREISSGLSDLLERELRAAGVPAARGI